MKSEVRAGTQCDCVCVCQTMTAVRPELITVVSPFSLEVTKSTAGTVRPSEVYSTPVCTVIRNKPDMKEQRNEWSVVSSAFTILRPDD